MKVDGRGEESCFWELLSPTCPCCSFFKISLNTLRIIIFISWEAVRIKGDYALMTMNWNFKETRSGVGRGLREELGTMGKSVQEPYRKNSMGPTSFKIKLSGSNFLLHALGCNTFSTFQINSFWGQNAWSILFLYRPSRVCMLNPLELVVNPSKLGILRALPFPP